MRIALATLFAAILLGAPFLAGAAVERTAIPLATITPSPAPITHILAPVVRLPSPTPGPVTGPPSNPSTPTVWMKPQLGHQVILSNVSESLTPQGNSGCMLFTISATLNAADAVIVLGYYTTHVNLVEARVYAPPSIVYILANASVRSYTESDGPSGSSVHLTMTAQKTSVSAGGATTDSFCVNG
jgi:hypothetical protein